MSTGFDRDELPESGQQTAGPKRQTLQSLEDAAGELARAMGLPGPRGQNQREALILAARRALDAPDLDSINLNAPEWDSLTP